MRETISELFAADGAVVDTAPNGTLGFAKVVSQSYDAVVSDIKMPGGDGIELMKKISAMTGSRPICFLCSGYWDGDKKSLLALGVTEVFEKPFDSAEIIRIIHDALVDGRKRAAY